MKRNNGYLDLNDYFGKIKHKNKWHNYDFLLNGIIEPSMYMDSHYWLKINGKKYYFKPTNYPYHEILGYFIAKYLGFNASFYDLAELKNIDHKVVKGVISESYRKKDAKYINGTELLGDYFKKQPEKVKDMGLTDSWVDCYEGPNFLDMNNLEIIWQALEYRYRNKKSVNIKALMDDIIEKYIFSILTRTNDLGAQNWEIEESNDGVKICPLFDNESIYFDRDVTASLSVGFQDNNQSIKESLKRFLTISSQEYIDLFIKKYEFLELEDFLILIKKVEEHLQVEIPREVKDELVNIFMYNRKEIAEVLEELNLNSKGR